MTQEIVDAVKALEQEKGIAADTLMDALEDALLSAYKKTPGAAKYARVDLDHETADFRVFELILPPGAARRSCWPQAAEAAGASREIDPETGRAARARGAASSSPEMTRRPTRTRSRPATSRPTTSAGSPPRPPSR